ncbi:penicillin-binding protein activator [Sphingomonas morindae]|uniref:Penicillin-binding protein activator n=1 Tax=Sphingomonas morindae TaxID=1541170 RepID=A0ABY4X8I7_9SPHN|nr:penicillin-binding protein activator [Sphingomonas morindae]USI73242.1 penicillin-binding protein activator [Sphingomonas morindae]
MSRRIAALGLAALLAGCSTLVPRTAGPASAPPPPPRPSAGTLPAEPQPRDRVAVLVPMTGPNAAVGQSIANAATMALLDSGGTQLRITSYDTAGGAAAAAARALADGNGLILGPLLAEDVRQVQPVAAAAHVPVLAFSNDIDVAGHGVYLLGYTPGQSIERVVGYAAQRGLKRIAALTPAGLYGRRASNALLRAAEQAGSTVVSMQSYDRSAASLAAAVKKLGPASGYDAVLIADSGRIALVAAPLIRRAGATARLLGTELWNTEPQLAAARPMAGAWYAAVSDRLYAQFATKYRARFGKGPYRLASLGYDAVLLAIRMAGEWKPGTPFPERRLTDSGGFAGIDGAFRFKDNIAERALDVKQIGQGGVTIVSPAATGF